jgi:uncharacterized membrane protein
MAVPVQMRAPIKSAAVSAQFTANTVVGVVVADALTAGAGASTTTLIAWLKAHWLGSVLGFFYGAGVAGAYRAKQGRDAATSIIRTDSYTSIPSSLTQPAPPEKGP